jgi:hypothetical protein
VKFNIPTSETIINNNLNSNSSASNNKLKESLMKENKASATNPDFHNIYDENTNPNNNNILTSETHKNSVKNIENKDKDSKKNHDQENLMSENNYNNINTDSNYCLTDANANFTESELLNNVLITETNYFNTKENSNNNDRIPQYLETLVSEAYKTTETEPNLNNLNLKKFENNINNDYIPVITDADATGIPEYLPLSTDLNIDAIATITLIPLSINLLILMRKYEKRSYLIMQTAATQIFFVPLMWIIFQWKSGGTKAKLKIILLFRISIKIAL